MRVNFKPDADSALSQLNWQRFTAAIGRVGLKKKRSRRQEEFCVRIKVIVVWNRELLIHPIKEIHERQLAPAGH